MRRGNTVLSFLFNYTDTAVTDNQKGLLNARRLAEYAYALPRTRWNVGIDQRIRQVQLLGRLSYYGGWYDYDSGFSTERISTRESHTPGTVDTAVSQFIRSRDGLKPILKVVKMESLSTFTSDYACLSVSGSRRSLTRPFRGPGAAVPARR